VKLLRFGRPVCKSYKSAEIHAHRQVSQDGRQSCRVCEEVVVEGRRQAVNCTHAAFFVVSSLHVARISHRHPQASEHVLSLSKLSQAYDDARKRPIRACATALESSARRYLLGSGLQRPTAAVCHIAAHIIGHVYHFAQ
jgi:hypothetical protein